MGYWPGRNRNVHRDSEVPGVEDPVPTRLDRELDESHIERHNEGGSSHETAGEEGIRKTSSTVTTTVSSQGPTTEMRLSEM